MNICVRVLMQRQIKWVEICFVVKFSFFFGRNFFLNGKHITNLYMQESYGKILFSYYDLLGRKFFKEGCHNWGSL